MRDVHGGNAGVLAARLGVPVETILDLSTNVFQACAGLTGRMVASTPPLFERYPDPLAGCLRQAVAAHEDVPETSVLPGNGAAEIIWLAFQALKPSSVLLLGPLFSEYTRACKALDIPWQIVTPPLEGGFAPDAASLQALRQSSADLAVICLPNNPGGLCYPELEPLFDALGKRIILADVSYREFLHGTAAYDATGHQALRALLAPGGELVSIHSLTKFFCCPGIRLGYGLAAENMVDRLAAVQPPWMIADWSARLGKSLLESIETYRERLPALRQSVAALAEGLASSGLFGRVFPGPSFVTAEVLDGRAQELWERLAARGVLIRLCDTIPGMPPGFVRIQAREPRDMEPFYRALGAIAAGWEEDQ